MYHEYHYVPVQVSDVHVNTHYPHQPLPQSQGAPVGAYHEIQPNVASQNQFINREMGAGGSGGHVHHPQHPHHSEQPNQLNQPNQSFYQPGFGSSIAPFLLGGVTGALVANHHQQPAYNYPPPQGYYPPYQPPYYPYPVQQGYPTAPYPVAPGQY